MIEYIPIISLLIALALILPVAIWLEKRGRDKKRSLIVPDERSFLEPGWSIKIAKIGSVAIILIILVCVSICLTGCGDNHKPNAAPDTKSGAESSNIDQSRSSFPDWKFPNFPTLPTPPGGTVTVTTLATTTTSTAPVSSGKETLSYSGRWNGDRPTWYGSKKLSAYPATITIDITGCFSRTIKHNGKRYESAGLIVKQSDVSGRGMAVVAPSSCQSTTASVRY